VPAQARCEPDLSALQLLARICPIYPSVRSARNACRPDVRAVTFRTQAARPQACTGDVHVAERGDKACPPQSADQHVRRSGGLVPSGLSRSSSVNEYVAASATMRKLVTNGCGALTISHPSVVYSNLVPGDPAPGLANATPYGQGAMQVRQVTLMASAPGWCGTSP
jgi:hypothetical protein